MAPIPDEVIFRCLARVRVRPGMYLGDETVRTLGAYLAGYQHALINEGLYEDSFAKFPDRTPDVLSAFARWLLVEANDTRTISWSALIESEDPSSRNIYSFYRRFEQFLETRGQNLDEWTPSWAK